MKPRTVRLKNKAGEFAGFLRECAKDQAAAGRTETARDYETAATYIEELLARVAAQDAILLNVRAALGEDRNR